jgi:hypothetical protein
VGNASTADITQVLLASALELTSFNERLDEALLVLRR